MKRPDSHKHIPVLLYHALYASGAEAALIAKDDLRFSVSVNSFRKHLAAISSLPNPSAQDDIEAPLFTFDDAHISHYRYAFPMVLEYDMQACFFITTGRAGRSGSVSWSQVREMASGGMRIGSHGVSHRFLTRLPREELKTELSDSKNAIEDEVGEAVDSLSVPGGRYSTRVLGAAREAGYELIFTSDIRLNIPGEQVLGRFCVRERERTETITAYVRADVNALAVPVRRQAAISRLRKVMGERCATIMLAPIGKLTSLRERRPTSCGESVRR